VFDHRCDHRTASETTRHRLCREVAACWRLRGRTTRALVIVAFAFDGFLEAAGRVVP